LAQSETAISAAPPEAVDGNTDLESILRSEVSSFLSLEASDLSERDLDTIAAVTGGLYASLIGEGSSPIIWPREVLSWGGHPGKAPPTFIDIAGPNRVLYHGPYFYLPRGRYVMQAHVGFSVDSVDHPFAIELHGVGCIASTLFKPPGSGWYHVQIEFTHKAATERVEVHFTSMRGAIRGRVAMHNVAFIPV
jgi:hypothetical protein